MTTILRRLTACLLACPLTALAAPDTTETVAPGVTYSEYTLAGPRRVFVVTAERNRPEYQLRVGWPSQRRDFSTRARTSDMAASYESSTTDVLAAVNASFYGTTPDIIGFTASSGEPLEMPSSTHDTAVITADQRAHVLEDIAHRPSTLRFTDGATLPIDRYNRAAQASQVTVYTETWKAVTGAALARPIALLLNDVTYPPRMGKTVRGRLANIYRDTEAGNISVPVGGLLILADDANRDLIDQHVSVGDTLELDFAAPPPLLNTVDLAITGVGYLVANGAANTSNWSQYNFSTQRHPRTVLAWNEEHWIFMTVDGRSSASIGMTFQDMATFLIDELHAQFAINLDGGGSTTLVVDGDVRNTPSDSGGERFVANCVMLVEDRSPSGIPAQDLFSSDGRQLNWDDRYRPHDVVPFTPNAPDGGDGQVLHLTNASQTTASTRLGQLAAADYAVHAHVYCDYRPDVANSGYERVGVFARDSGVGGFGLNDGVGYALTFDTNTGRIRAGAYQNGQWADYLQQPLLMPTSRWRQFRIEVQGDMIRYRVDGNVIAEHQSTLRAYGQFGLGYTHTFPNPALASGGRFDNFAVTLTGGDFDADSDTDNADFARLQFCFGGPDSDFVATNFCRNGDADGDRDVDLIDAAWFQRAFSP